MRYQTHGTCSGSIQFDVTDDGKVCNVKFVGGCDGNSKGVANLVEGMPIDEVITKLKGISCGYKKTSCPDQLALALEQYKKS
jgi:uncharacterized protein TIGR03905